MAKIFDNSLRSASPAHEELVRKYELYRTLVDFWAAVMFIIGSFFFFYESLLYAGTWLFVIGSFLFAVRPTIRLMLELRLVRLPLPEEFLPLGYEIKPDERAV